jgi:hypothetical protein
VTVLLNHISKVQVKLMAFNSKGRNMRFVIYVNIYQVNASAGRGCSTCCGDICLGTESEFQLSSVWANPSRNTFVIRVNFFTALSSSTTNPNEEK